MDSGAFTEISTHGRFREPVDQYVEQIERWSRCGNLECAVSQDYMCEPWIIERTGLSVREHQERTVERFDAITSQTDVPVMPVLQGYTAKEYVHHLSMYGDRLKHGMRVGVGSVCKRNSSVIQIEAIMLAVRDMRPDLKLHGFGIKSTSLGSAIVSDALYSADSMAWSFAARYEGRDGNDPREAIRYEATVNAQPKQTVLDLPREFWA